MKAKEVSTRTNKENGKLKEEKKLDLCVLKILLLEEFRFSSPRI